MRLRTIVRPSRIFYLREGFTLDVDPMSDEIMRVGHPLLPVSGYGPSLEVALAEFEEMFEVQWVALVEDPHWQLAPDALRARENFQYLVVKRARLDP